jgi:hypothetical protein
MMAAVSIDESDIYAAVAARRANFDAMLWQVPVLSLTAQAFLFTISLGHDSSKWSRVIASLLSLVVTALSIVLMARQRQAEVTDAHLLAELEQHAKLPAELWASGAAWRERRNHTQMIDGWANRIPLLPGYKTWVIGLGAFGLAAAAVLILALARPAVF